MMDEPTSVDATPGNKGQTNKCGACHTRIDISLKNYGGKKVKNWDSWRCQDIYMHIQLGFNSCTDLADLA